DGERARVELPLRPHVQEPHARGKSRRDGAEHQGNGAHDDLARAVGAPQRAAEDFRVREQRILAEEGEESADDDERERRHAEQAKLDDDARIDHAGEGDHASRVPPPVIKRPTSTASTSPDLNDPTTAPRANTTIRSDSANSSSRSSETSRIA